MKILNQGDKLAFRVANKDVCSYESNDEETINNIRIIKKSDAELVIEGKKKTRRKKKKYIYLQKKL